MKSRARRISACWNPVIIVSYGVNLFASTKTPDDVVYKVVKALHDNAADFGKVFPPLRLFDKPTPWRR